MNGTVYVVEEIKLGVEDGEPVVAWQHISIYSDRSQAYEYASKVDSHIDVIVRKKDVLDDLDYESERLDDLIDSSDEGDNNED